MPATIVLDLHAPDGVPVHPVRLHGAACALFDTDGGHPHPRPFAVGPVHAGRDGPVWHLGWLRDAAPPGLPNTVDLGGRVLPVLRHTTRPVSYAELAQTPATRRVEIEVLTPLYFSRNGRDHPLPDPLLVVQSLTQRWNAHAPEPLAIPDAERRDLTATVYLAAMTGGTRTLPLPGNRDQTGFVGTVQLALTRDATTPTARLFAALTRFANIAGIGAQTTHGFGAVRARSNP
ncbi:MAG TPA: CRISPR system precrRNA processing endoribonuclease RAMP protein Cas6 [Micromonosporaceae bacterium]|nr:CRISPR system precrRNA processing endoribonuclease RAMP protein Cas6 [Micromonosporaceae bacterium]